MGVCEWGVLWQRVARLVSCNTTPSLTCHTVCAVCSVCCRTDSARWPVPPERQGAPNATQQPLSATLQQQWQLRRQRRHRQHPRVLTRADVGRRIKI